MSWTLRTYFYVLLATNVLINNVTSLKENKEFVRLEIKMLKKSKASFFRNWAKIQVTWFQISDPWSVIHQLILVFHSVLLPLWREGRDFFWPPCLEKGERSEKIYSMGGDRGKKGVRDIFFHYFGGETEIFMIQKLNNKNSRASYASCLKV